MGYLFKGECRRGIFSIPHALFDDGTFRKLTPAACKLLGFLYHDMNRRSAPCIRISLTQLALELGMDKKTIRAARKVLESKGAIRCRRARAAGGRYEFHLVNPETGKPFPPQAERPEIADYKPRKPKVADTAYTPVLATVSTKGESPPRSAAAPLGAASQERLRQCDICKGTDVWKLPDGTPRCSNCHPNPNGPTGTDSPMTADGLVMKF